MKKLSTIVMSVILIMPTFAYAAQNVTAQVRDKR